MKIIDKALKLPGKIIDKTLEILGKVPTTQLRIVVTLALVVGTAIKIWTSQNWSPEWDWLLFLAGMAGLDVLQHYGKRKTSWKPTEHANAVRIQNGHAPAGDEEVGEEEIG